MSATPWFLRISGRKSGHSGGVSSGLCDFIRPSASPRVTSAPIVATCTSVESAGGEAGDARVQKIEVAMTNERQLSEVRFLTVAEVASIMRVSKMTVYRLVHSGDLPAVRVGRSFRVPEDAVHTYLQTSFIDTA